MRSNFYKPVPFERDHLRTNYGGGIYGTESIESRNNRVLWAMAQLMVETPFDYANIQVNYDRNAVLARIATTYGYKRVSTFKSLATDGSEVYSVVVEFKEDDSTVVLPVNKVMLDAWLNASAFSQLSQYYDEVLSPSRVAIPITDDILKDLLETVIATYLPLGMQGKPRDVLPHWVYDVTTAPSIESIAFGDFEGRMRGLSHLTAYIKHRTEGEDADNFTDQAPVLDLDAEPSKATKRKSAK